MPGKLNILLLWNESLPLIISLAFQFALFDITLVILAFFYLVC